MQQAQIVEDIALVLVSCKLQEFTSLRLSEDDLSMESVVKNMATKRGVDYRSLLPMDLALEVFQVIKSSLAKDFDEIAAQYPEAILWEARQIVYGGDLSLTAHPGASQFLEKKGVSYRSPLARFKAPEDEVNALKKAIFDQ